MTGGPHCQRQLIEIDQVLEPKDQPIVKRGLQVVRSVPEALAPLERFPPCPTGPEASVEIFGRFITKVLKLDSYERRQISRRKVAIRALYSVSGQ
jgi:hypothetical protein